MKQKDIILILVLLLLFVPLILWDKSLNAYLDFNQNHGMLTSFIKFGILATFGEVLGLRIRTGGYNIKGFGIFPKAIVWGFIGLSIKLAFVIFSIGTPAFLSYLGLKEATTLMQSPLSANKILVAFSISAAMNIIYAPVMMTFHKITDSHIARFNGKTVSLISPIKFSSILTNIDWNVQWNFVFKKTIPLFWIPAHTVTFLLPPEFQVLFAALLSIVLGLILAVASLKSEK